MACLCIFQMSGLTSVTRQPSLPFCRSRVLPSCPCFIDLTLCPLMALGCGHVPYYHVHFGDREMELYRPSCLHLLTSDAGFLGGRILYPLNTWSTQDSGLLITRSSLDYKAVSLPQCYLQEMCLIKASGKSFQPGGQDIAFDIFLRWERMAGRELWEKKRDRPPAN